MSVLVGNVRKMKLVCVLMNESGCFVADAESCTCEFFGDQLVSHRGKYLFIDNPKNAMIVCLICLKNVVKAYIAFVALTFCFVLLLKKELSVET